jgi:acetaldehyde dehydrogenase (acetylating)
LNGLSLRDRDLISIQEARQAVERASEAQGKFAAFSQTQADAIVDACAEAATAAGEQLARLAVEETGYGNVPDKIIKNRHASVNVPRAIRGMKTVGIIREDREQGIVEVAEPVGVVAAVIPSTNPTSTAIYKTLISLKARNAVVLSPHPTAMRCICETVSVLERAALRAGAPEGLIVCLLHPTLQGTQELMRQRAVGVILATGGTGLVRAAYSSGKPAYGVGPGNVPAFIERTANVRKAVADIIAGKTFDYGTICSSEQAIVAESAVGDQVLEECRQQGAYLLSADEIRRLGDLVIVPGTFTPNPKIVGRPATLIAEIAGIKVPAPTRVLIAKLDGVGRDNPLSAEKLSPILAFYSVVNLAEGIAQCKRLLEFGGLGHTISIHSQSEAAVREFGQGVPAYRVCVNTSAVHGSIGYSTNLFPAMTLGCGAPGGNITSDNIGPQHLMNVKRIAWESRPVEHRTIPPDQRMIAMFVPTPERRAAAAAATATEAGSAATSRAPVVPVPDKQLIAGIVEKVMATRGIPRGGFGGMQSSSASSATGASTVAPTPAEVASAAVSAVFGTPPAGNKSASPAQARVASTATSEAGLVISARESSAVKISEFVSENDVRSAITHGEKIFIGPKTIVTPSARDLASANEVLVETSVPLAASGNRVA